MIEQACAFTGHRDLTPEFSETKLYYALSDLLDEGVGTFYCGMARGFDLEALACLLSFRPKRHFTVEACVPYEGHESSIPARERGRYRELLAACDRKTVLFPSYRNGCLLARDRYMVDRSDILLAYCTKETGGAAYTVKYAESRGIEIRKI